MFLLRERTLDEIVSIMSSHPEEQGILVVGLMSISNLLLPGIQLILHYNNTIFIERLKSSLIKFMVDFGI